MYCEREFHPSSPALAMDCRDEGLEVTPETQRNDDRRRKMAAEVQLIRYIQSTTVGRTRLNN
jgi:hypothetical protein